MKANQINENCLTANSEFFENAQLIGVGDLEGKFESVDLKNGGTVLTGPVIANFEKDGERKCYCTTPCHALVVGGTGSGKTQCYFSAQAEAIARSENKPSVFFMDLKGDYFKTFSELYESMGYKVYTLNLKEPFKSCRYNPLTPAWDCYRRASDAKKLLATKPEMPATFNGISYAVYADWYDAVNLYCLENIEECQNYLRRISHMIITVESQKDPSWEFGAREMFYQQAWGLLEDSDYPARHMTREKFTIANVVRITSASDNDCAAIYDWIDARELSSTVRGLHTYYPHNARVTRDGFISSFSTKADKWKGYSTEWITSYSDLDIEKIVHDIDRQRVAIFCITDETRPESYDICMCLIDNLISALKIRCDKQGPMKNDFHILADEFANMPPLPNIQNRITTLRSYKIWLHMGIQSYDQLDDKYGANIRNIILDNCDCQVFFGTNNSKTVKEFASSLGERTAAVTSYSVHNDGNLAVNIQAASRPLVKNSDLSSVKLGQAYIKLFRLPTVFTELQPHFSCGDLFHGSATPKTMRSDLKKLKASYYDIKELKDLKPIRRSYY